MAGHCCAAEKPAGGAGGRGFEPCRSAARPPANGKTGVHHFNSGRGRTAISDRRGQQMASCARNVAERCASARTGNRGSPARKETAEARAGPAELVGGTEQFG